MPPKSGFRRRQTEDGFSRPPTRARRNVEPAAEPANENPHGFTFINPAHEVRYSKLKVRRLIRNRYMCPATLAELGLSEDVHRLLNKIGLLDFMLRTTPTYERITLEFLSTVEYEVHTE